MLKRVRRVENVKTEWKKIRFGFKVKFARFLFDDFELKGSDIDKGLFQVVDSIQNQSFIRN